MQVFRFPIESPVKSERVAKSILDVDLIVTLSQRNQCIVDGKDHVREVSVWECREDVSSVPRVGR